MKSLQESLFDDDLIEKNINFFDFYSWYYGVAYVVLPNGNEIPLRVALKNEIKFDQLFKKDKLNKLPYPKDLVLLPREPVEKSSDEYIFRNIYNALLTSSIKEFGERWELAKIVSDAARELLKAKTMGGGTRCNIYPFRSIKNTLDSDIRSITIIDEINFKITDDTYQLKVTVALKRKH